MMKPRFPHLPPVLAPEKLVLHCGDHAPTRTSIAHQPVAKLAFGAARPPHLLLAPTTTAMPHAGCHAPAPGGPTMQLALDLRVQAQLAPPVPGSTQHAPAECSPSPHSRGVSPAHTRGWLPA